MVYISIEIVGSQNPTYVLQKNAILVLWFAGNSKFPTCLFTEVYIHTFVHIRVYEVMLELSSLHVRACYFGFQQQYLVILFFILCIQKVA